MDLNIARKIAEAGEDDGIEITIHDGYSGRGMMGEKTTGLVFGHVGDFAAAAISATEVANDSCDGQAAAAIFNACRKVRTDSMGRDIIVY